MLVKNFGNFSADFLELLIFASWITVVASTTCLLGTAAYFANVQSGSMSSHVEADQPTLEKEQP
jgi:hypothetical protein